MTHFPDMTGRKSVDYLAVADVPIPDTLKEEILRSHIAILREQIEELKRQLNNQQHHAQAMLQAAIANAKGTP